MDAQREADYRLAAFDAAGSPRFDARELTAGIAEQSPTDVFVFSHGWFGDVRGSREQYDAWWAAMAACPDDRLAAEARADGLRFAAVGIHWPSLAWGDESLASFAVTAGDLDHDEAVAGIVESSVAELADTASVRDAVATIIDAALDDPIPATLPKAVRDAYLRIDAELGMSASGEGAAPGDDRAGFDPESMYQACLIDDLVSYGSTSLGGLLAPLRVLSFWHMKRRARDVGSSGVAALLGQLQIAVPGAAFHLAGHSFGCIVMSSALAARARPVDSLVLIQGAMSLWSFCSSIPSAPERAGFFRRVIADDLVRGPVVATTSAHDRAVRTFYPLGAGARGQVDYAPVALPTYGGLGTFGIQGPGITIEQGELGPVTADYGLRPGVAHNLRADDVIRESRGLMGAHSDIAKPAVAHVVWQAALTASALG